MTETHSTVIETENFIRSGFFPKELVPAFTTEGLANNLDKVNDIVQATLPKTYSKCSYYFETDCKQHCFLVHMETNAHVYSTCI